MTTTQIDQLLGSSRQRKLGAGSLQTLAILDLCGGSAKLGVIAGRLCVSTAAMTSLADRLTKAGLVQRSFPKTDRRVIHLELTFHGREVLKQILSENSEPAATA